MDIDPAMVESLSENLNARNERVVPDYLMRDKLYPGEEQYFKTNPHVGGMAADDNKIIMNPYSQLKPEEKESVKVNELTRLYLRNSNTPLKFGVTDEQRKIFGNYSKDENDIRATILGRIVSGDPSARNITPEQADMASQIRSKLFNSKYGLRHDGTPKGTGWLGELPITLNGRNGVASEYSIGIDIDGKRRDIPSLVPGLTEEQKKLMLEKIIPNHERVPEDIMQVAVKHARERIKQGLSPYKD